MAKDIEQELDAIFAYHKARVAEARNEAAARPSAEEDFSQSRHGLPGQCDYACASADGAGTQRARCGGESASGRKPCAD